MLEGEVHSRLQVKHHVRGELGQRRHIHGLVLQGAVVYVALRGLVAPATSCLLDRFAWLYNLADLNELGQRSEEDTGHVGVVACIVTLLRRLIGQKSAFFSGVKLKLQIVRELLVVQTLLVQELQLCLSEIASIAGQNLGVIDLGELLVDHLRPLLTLGRQRLDKLISDESQVKNHIVAYHWFLRVRNQFDHLTETNFAVKQRLSLHSLLVCQVLKRVFEKAQRRLLLTKH